MRYAIVGTGSRAGMYVAALTERAHTDLVALSDTNSGRTAYWAEEIARLGAPTPSRWSADRVAEMIHAEHVDRVVVTSPDATHADVVATALHAGADVVVEKPLTTTAEGTRIIAEAIDATGGDVVATFNYRYSPRNSTLRRVIADGMIGRPLSVHFEWLLDTNHGADYFRRWHRDKANSGGLLVHKASHHFDLVNWWIDDVPVSVVANGGLRFYGAANASARGLGERPLRGTRSDLGEPAPVDHDGTPRGHTDPWSLDLRDDERLRRLYLDNEELDGYRRDQDVFSDGITIEDDVSLVVGYASGASMSYSLTAHAPWEGYRIAVNGTEGRVELDVVERGSVAAGRAIDPSTSAPDGAPTTEIRPESERLVVQRHWERASEIPIETGGGAHGGGDALLLADLFDRDPAVSGTGGDPLHRAADHVDGARAVAVGIAGNRSLLTGEVVRIADLDLGIDISRA
jgi:predicted dehydrogenase